MLDRYGRDIDYIRISVTDRCNLRCIYCMPEEGVEKIQHKEILTYDEIVELVTILADMGISRIKITGGEPLVRKNLCVLVERLKKIKGIKSITLTTNGILLKEQLPKLIAAGLDGVNISLDTLDEELYAKLTRRNQLSEAMKGLKAAIACSKLVVKVNCVLIPGESGENFLSLANLAKENPVHVRFIEMMPIGYGKQFACWKEAQIREILENAYGPMTPYKERLGNGPCHYFSLEGFQGKIGFISAISHKFCSTCNRIRLTSEGYLKTCLQYSCGVDLKSVLRQEEDLEIKREIIKEAVTTALSQKPDSHRFECGEKAEQEEKHTMSQIGG